MNNSLEEFKAQQFTQNQRASLLEKIRLATKLGFTDDVRHWKSELTKLDTKEEAKD